jgi:hypothetical protein
MDSAAVNVLIFNTMDNNNIAISNYVIDGRYYYLFDTDTLNSENCPSIMSKHMKI